MSPTPPISFVSIDDINHLLDAYRKRHGLSSDEKLAQRIGYSGQAIYRWRRGEIDRAALALLTLERELSTAEEISADALEYSSAA